MFKFLLPVLLYSLNSLANHPLEGTWKGNGSAIDLFQWKGKLVGSLTGSTDYLFSYDIGSLQGSLITYDSKHGCKLENGDSKITVLNSNKILVVFNRINFKVNKTYVGSTTITAPMYCNYGMGPFICGWQEQDKAPSKIDCEVTFRQPIQVELNRVL